MRHFHWFGCFLAMALALSSCAPADAVTGMNEQIVQSLDLEPASPPQAQAAPQATEAAETNECLDCHSNKDRLIDTSDPVEETAEAESKGVG